MSDLTVPEALAWLGVTPEAYRQAAAASKGRHGGPMISALMDARRAHQSGDGTTAEAILARHGIDPANPTAAHRAYDEARTATD